VAEARKQAAALIASAKAQAKSAKRHGLFSSNSIKEMLVIQPPKAPHNKLICAFYGLPIIPGVRHQPWKPE
jgi:hypothetical protein